MLRTNRLRERLSNGQPTVGTRLACTWPTLTELIGYSGAFDYVEILAEYAPFDLFGLENIGRAIELHGMSGVIKVGQESREFQAVKALSYGIQNVLFTDVHDSAEVEHCVKTVRAESPATGGRRGVCMGRDVGITQEPGQPFYVQSTKDTVVLCMIEKKEAVENLESILDVEGLDMVQFGPADYAMSIGRVGDWKHPEVLDAEKRVIETALEKGVAPRVEAGSAEDTKRYIDLGVRHFCIGMDTVILSRWYKEHGGAIRDMLAGV
jgi:4-hydroxy-2-oxoheptanedioate aldolase